MKLTRLLFLMIVFFPVLQVSSQVTIGSNETPNEGALLDLKEETQDDGSANSNKGLGLPRVALVAFQQLEPCATTNTVNKASHIGLVVYNTTNTGIFTPGLYAWDGLSWQRVTRDTPQGFGPWYEIGSTPAVPAIGNTTDSYLKAKVAIGGTSIIDDAQLSVHGNTAVNGNVTIQPGTGTNTGLVLPNGGGEERILVSDTEGKAKWVTGQKQLQTMAIGGGGKKVFTIANPAVDNMALINVFSLVEFDGAKDVYGAPYGWNTTTNQYRVPATGLYRIAMNIYFRRATAPEAPNLGQNNKAFVYKNNLRFADPGFISVAETKSDQSAHVMGIVTLNKDDLIDFRLAAPEDGPAPSKIALWAGRGHTFVLIESL